MAGKFRSAKAHLTVRSGSPTLPVRETTPYDGGMQATGDVGRQAVLRDLVELRATVSDMIARLAGFEGPSAQDLVTLRTLDIAFALDRYQRALIGNDELTSWAETVHSLDDIALDPQDHDFLANSLFELSTPELFGDMKDIVQTIKARMPCEVATTVLGKMS